MDEEEQWKQNFKDVEQNMIFYSISHNGDLMK